MPPKREPVTPAQKLRDKAYRAYKAKTRVEAARLYERADRLMRSAAVMQAQALRLYVQAMLLEDG